MPRRSGSGSEHRSFCRRRDACWSVNAEAVLTAEMRSLLARCRQALRDGEVAFVAEALVRYRWLPRTKRSPDQARKRRRPIDRADPEAERSRTCSRGHRLKVGWPV